MEMSEVKKAMRLNLKVCYIGSNAVYTVYACRMRLDKRGNFYYTLELLDQVTKNGLVVVPIEDVEIKTI